LGFPSVAQWWSGRLLKEKMAFLTVSEMLSTIVKAKAKRPSTQFTAPVSDLVSDGRLWLEQSAQDRICRFRFNLCRLGGPKQKAATR
jgi:hypothetical protein